MQITKLQESIKSKFFTDRKTGAMVNTTGNVEVSAAVKDSEQFKFSKISGDHDFHLMISKEQEQVYSRMRDENQDLRDCLRHLQKEIMDIVNLKQDMFTRRFKAEYGANREAAPETQDALMH